VLSDAEILALLLGSGMPGENVVDLSRRILDSQGGFSGLLRADVQSLQQVRGLGPAKSAQVAAAIEFGRRAGEFSMQDRTSISPRDAVFESLRPRLLGGRRERLFVPPLNTRGRLLGAPAVFEGHLNAINLRVGEVFRQPVLQDACSVVVAHNHPSG